MAETTSSSKSEEEKEEMLDRLLTRLALSDDSKLEALLSKLLPYTISSLSSPSSAVRNKVASLFSLLGFQSAIELCIDFWILRVWSWNWLENCNRLWRYWVMWTSEWSISLRLGCRCRNCRVFTPELILLRWSGIFAFFTLKWPWIVPIERSLFSVLYA